MTAGVTHRQLTLEVLEYETQPGQWKEMFPYTFPGNSEEGRHDTTTSFCGGEEALTRCDHVVPPTFNTRVLMSAEL